MPLLLRHRVRQFLPGSSEDSEDVLRVVGRDVLPIAHIRVLRDHVVSLCAHVNVVVFPRSRCCRLRECLAPLYAGEDDSRIDDHWSPPQTMVWVTPAPFRSPWVEVITV